MSLRTRLNSSHPIWKALLWIALMTGAFILLMIIARFLGSFGLNELSVLRTVQVLQSLLVFILPAIVAVWCWSPSPLKELRCVPPASPHVYWLVPLLMLCAVPGINMLADWNGRVELPSFLADLEETLKQKEEEAAMLTERLLHADHIGGLLANIVLIALLPAVGEELCFRGVMLNLCLNGGGLSCATTKKRMHLSVWVTAALFSFIHFQFYGFVPRMLLGALFGYLVLWSGSLWTSVIAHFVNNAVATVAYYICAHSSLDSCSLDSFGTGDTAWVGWLSIVVAVSVAVLMRNVCQQQSAEPLP